MVKIDRDFWHVISIHGPRTARNFLPGAKRVLYVSFDDVENPTEDGSSALARASDIQSIFEFADVLPRAPLLVHCLLGLSRSAAIALTFIVRGLLHSNNLVEDAAAHLLIIRPHACPNVHVLRLGLRQFLPAKRAEELAVSLANHPPLFSNRFLRQ